MYDWNDKEVSYIIFCRKCFFNFAENYFSIESNCQSIESYYMKELYKSTFLYLGILG